MKLIKFLEQCKQIIEENPAALDMEMITDHSASGTLEPVSYPYITPIDYFDNSETPIRELLPRDYNKVYVIRICIGN